MKNKMEMNLEHLNLVIKNIDEIERQRTKLFYERQKIISNDLFDMFSEEDIENMIEITLNEIDKNKENEIEIERLEDNFDTLTDIQIIMRKEIN
jgi:hypothetical protein